MLYRFFFSPRIFEDVKDYGKYFGMVRKAASLLKDVQSKGITGVLYAMSFYTASVESMKTNNIPQEDIDTILRVSNQLTTVHKRLVIDQSDCNEEATRKILSQVISLGVLKSSSIVLSNSVKKRREAARATFMPVAVLSQ